MTISALLMKLIKTNGPDSAKLGELLGSARQPGIADTPLSQLTALNGATK